MCGDGPRRNTLGRDMPILPGTRNGTKTEPATSQFAPKRDTAFALKHPSRQDDDAAKSNAASIDGPWD